MGYLSQKKQQERINLFLNVTGFAALAFTLVVLFEPSWGIYHHFINYYFQYYIVLLVVFCYALYVSRYAQATVLLSLIILNFFRLSPYANLFFNISGKGNESLKVVYQNSVQSVTASLDSARQGQAEVVALNADSSLPYVYDYIYKQLQTEDTADKSFIFSSLPAERGGRVHFTPERMASYLNVKKGDKQILLLNVNFTDLSDAEVDTVYNNLTEFVLEQNLPIVIIGNFGLPSWSQRFQKFLTDTELEVKNRIILSDGRHLFNPLQIPELNVLGYKALGLVDIDFLSEQESGGYPILFKLRL